MKPASSRRLFLACTALLGGGSLILLGRGLFSFIGASGEPDPPARFPLAKVADLKRTKEPWKYHQGVWLFRDEGGWYAILNRCTHLGCSPALDGAHRLLVCPCHGSRFDLQGRVVRGPAARPLARPALFRGDREEIWVDIKKEADPALRLRL